MCFIVPLLIPRARSALRIVTMREEKARTDLDDFFLYEVELDLGCSTEEARTSNCYTDIKNWMTKNKLQLNDKKTD